MLIQGESTLEQVKKHIAKLRQDEYRISAMTANETDKIALIELHNQVSIIRHKIKHLKAALLTFIDC